jgi:hypothetical protein
MKLHIRHLQIQFVKVTIAGVFDTPVLVLFSSVTTVTSGSGNSAILLVYKLHIHVFRHTNSSTTNGQI